MALASGHPQLDLSALRHQEHGSGLNRLVAMLREALPDIPATIVGQRFGLAFEQLIHALADREKLRQYAPDSIGFDSALFVSNLVDCIAGAMAAPVSAQTMAELHRIGKSAS
jgi:hypothetical protein